MIGVLADDTTGANDVGISFQKGGAGVKVVTFDIHTPLVADTDALVIDTNTRFDQQSIAYEKVYAATRQLVTAGCTRFYKKTCSALRGNIGAEFAGMLDGSQIISMIICVAYPANGRATINGRHFINGIPLEETNFNKDPVHPMKRSDLQGIIRQQSSRSILLIPLEEVRRGVTSLRQVLERAARSHTYLVVDGETQEDLATLAEAANNFSAFGGSAGLGEELARQFGPLKGPLPLDERARLSSGASLVICGSLTPESIEQTRRLAESGVNCAIFDSTDIFEPAKRDAWLEKSIRAGRQALASGSDFLIHPSQDPDSVRATKQLAREFACDAADLGRKLSALQAEACARILADSPPHPVIVAGGDTAAAVCERMGIRESRIIEEIDAGVPISQAIEPARLIVLKSGAFGRPDFLLRACKRLRALCSSQA